MLFRSIESFPFQLDQVLHTFRSPSSSSAKVVASGFDDQDTSSIGMPNQRDDTHDLDPPIPMTVLHLDQTAPPAHDIAAATLPLEGQVWHDLDELSYSRSL